MTRAIIASMLMMMGVTAAAAADLDKPYSPDRADTVQDIWSGVWVGAVAGYAVNAADTQYDHSYIDGEGKSHPIFGIDIDGLAAKGLFGEVQLGANYRMPGTVMLLGVRGGYNFSNADFEASLSSQGTEVAKLTSGIGSGWHAGPSLGWIMGNTLFYVSGGVAGAKMDDPTLTVGSESGSIKGPSLVGWYGEVGLEHQIGNGLAITVAGRYSDFGRKQVWNNGDENCPESISVDVSQITPMVGLTYRFGGQ